MYDHERSLVQQYEGQPFALIGVNSDDKRSVAGIQQKKNLTWRSFLDGSTGGPISRSWGIRGWPTIYVIDDRGVIRAMNKRGSELDKVLEALVEEAKQQMEKLGSSAPAVKEDDLVSDAESDDEDSDDESGDEGDNKKVDSAAAKKKEQLQKARQAAGGDDDDSDDDSDAEEVYAEK